MFAAAAGASEATQPASAIPRKRPIMEGLPNERDGAAQDREGQEAAHITVRSVALLSAVRGVLMADVIRWRHVSRCLGDHTRRFGELPGGVVQHHSAGR